jgi:hypothetical protein
MTYSVSLSPWGALADEIDPPEPPAELSDPVSLAVANDSKYFVRAHLRVIGDAMARLRAGEYDRLMINQPPQTGKSVTAVEWGAFWFLCLDPTTNVVVGSYDTSLALRRGKAIRRLVSRYGAKSACTSGAGPPVRRTGGRPPGRRPFVRRRLGHHWSPCRRDLH